MKRKDLMICKKTLSALLCAASVIILCSCTDRNTENETDLFAMYTYMTLKAYGENSKSALEKASAKIRELEELLSVTDENSEIFGLNSADGKRTEISDDTSFLIKRSLEINKSTNAAFDITLYPVSREWGFTTGDYKVPAQTRLDELLKSVGSENIILDTNDNSVSLLNGANIDLGGIAKGYAGKCAAEILKNEGIKSAILNMGGNVQTIGAKPDGSSWIVGIQDPTDSHELVGTVEVIDKAVVTSGGYERYFEDEAGNTYWHILDPKTGRPAKTDILSVTVIGIDGTTCDALSTSLFVMGIDSACGYLRSNREYDAVMVSDDKTLYITQGITESFSVSDKFSGYKIVTV